MDLRPWLLGLQANPVRLRRNPLHPRNYVRGFSKVGFKASLSRSAETFRIDYSLQKANTLETIASDYVTGTGEERFPSLVDNMTRKIKENFKLSAEEIASDIDKEVGKMTNRSPEAYIYCSEGRKYINKGESCKSIPFMEKAVAIDPEFAMAYRSMAVSYGNLGYESERKKYLQKAFERIY